MSSLVIRNVGKRWQEGGRPVLSDVSLRIDPGKTLYLIGPNGSGKSTLLKIIAGQIRPDSGEVLVSGVDVTRLSVEEAARQVAHIPQDPALCVNPEQTVLEHLILARGVAANHLPFLFPKWRLRREMQEHLRSLGFGVAERIDNPVGTLSGGERQALILAMSLWRRPEVLLADEFKKELDDRAREVVDSLMVKVMAEVQPAALVVTHDLTEALQRADRIALIREGTIVKEIERGAEGDPHWTLAYLRGKLWLSL